MNIHEYVTKTLCIIDHAMKDSCLLFNLIPGLIVSTEKQLAYNWLCRYTPIIEINIMGCHGNHAITKIVNEYDQEIPQSQTADNPVAP